MLVASKRVAALFVDTDRQQWVVRDSEGEYWSLPSSEHPWDDRQPYTPAEVSELKPVPGHYKYILGLP